MSQARVELAIREANPVPETWDPPTDAVNAASVLAVISELSTVSPTERHRPGWTPPKRWWLAAGAAALSALILIGGVALLDTGGGDVVSPDTSIAVATTIPSDVTVIPADARRLPLPGQAVATRATPLPDIANAELADAGAAPSPLRAVSELSNPDRLDFLFEICDQADACFRDARFVDTADPLIGSGGWPADRPFHVRHGFPVSGPEPLGEGFDVAVYVFSLQSPSEFGAGTLGVTKRYTSDYVLRGDSDACGPAYRTQEGTVPCEWFVHDFAEGLPEGRWAMWVVWEAPCSAWNEYGLTEPCPDPNEILSFFSSGVDSPFVPSGPGVPEYSELDMGPRARG